MIDPTAAALDIAEDDFVIDRRALVALAQWAAEVGQLAREAKACRQALEAERPIIDSTTSDVEP